VALLLLLPMWVFGGGVPRMSGVFSAKAAGVAGGAAASSVLLLCVWDGVLYYTEQIAQVKSIDLLSPLSLGVVDTVRRLFIVVVAGFVLQGNPVTTRGVVGAALVCSGAIFYALIMRSATTGKEDGKKKE